MLGTNRLVRVPFFIVLATLLVFGCEGRGTPPEVPVGQYTAYVDGTIRDTLRGEAHYRLTNGDLTRLELGRNKGPGLSIELEPYPLELRTYEVVETELFQLDRSNSPPGVLAFLGLKNAQLEATHGTLQLTYISDTEVGATFKFQMEGYYDSGEDASAEVTGVLNAPPEK